MAAVTEDLPGGTDKLSFGNVIVLGENVEGGKTQNEIDGAGLRWPLNFRPNVFF